MSTVDAVNENDIDATAQRWVVRLASREIEEPELSEFEVWLQASPLHRPAFDRARAVWLRASQLNNLAPEDVPGRRPLSQQRKRLVALAAGMGAVSLACFLLLDPLTRVQADAMTSTGEVRRFELPDGSIAMLDTKSAIDVDYAAGLRRVHVLRGAAWFDVKPDARHPFIVQANDVRAIAKGTAYGVTRMSDGAHVEVTHGRVEVSFRDHTATLLAGDAITANAEGVSPVSSDHGPVAWRFGRIEIQNASLEEAVREIDRYRPGRIAVIGKLPEVQVNVSIDIEEQDRGLASLVQTQSLRRTDITPWLTILRPN